MALDLGQRKTIRSGRDFGEFQRTVYPKGQMLLGFSQPLPGINAGPVLTAWVGAQGGS